MWRGGVVAIEVADPAMIEDRSAGSTAVQVAAPVRIADIAAVSADGE